MLFEALNDEGVERKYVKEFPNVENLIVRDIIRQCNEQADLATDVLKVYNIASTEEKHLYSNYYHESTKPRR